MKKITCIMAAFFVLAACKNTADRAETIEDTRQATIDSMKTEMAKQEAEERRQRSIDSMKAVADAKAAEAAARAQRPVVVNNTTAEQERKGWSNAAKGAVIGAGVGAVTGAAVSKKKGEGAVIGGLAGAGVGAGTGAIIDDSKKKKKK